MKVDLDELFLPIFTRKLGFIHSAMFAFSLKKAASEVIVVSKVPAIRLGSYTCWLSFVWLGVKWLVIGIVADFKKSPSS